MMYCKRCNVEKGEDEFPRNKSKPSGRGFYCNACMYERLKEWRKANPGKVKSIAKRRYDKIHGEVEDGTSVTVCPE